MQATFEWGKVINAVRAFVVQHVETDDGTKDYLKMMMRETDTFHDYATMDNFYNTIKLAPEELNIDHIYDELYAAVNYMFEEIEAHFNNSWNFAPGYVRPELKTPNAYYMDEKLFEALLQSAVPEVYKAAKAKRDAELAEEARERAAIKAQKDAEKAARKAKRDAKMSAAEAQRRADNKAK